MSGDRLLGQLWYQVDSFHSCPVKKNFMTQYGLSRMGKLFTRESFRSKTVLDSNILAPQVFIIVLWLQARRKNLHLWKSKFTELMLNSSRDSNKHICPMFMAKQWSLAREKGKNSLCVVSIYGLKGSVI